MFRILSIFLVLAVVVTPASAFGGDKHPDTTRTLIGKVLDRHEQPLAKAIVYLKNTRTQVVKSYITNPDGSYHFPALATNIDYEVYAEYQGARSDTKVLSLFDPRKQVEITLRMK
jgi:hypothetical protein